MKREREESVLFVVIVAFIILIGAKKHAQVINESTSHLFFSFQKRISSRIPSTTDGGIAKKSRRSRRGVVRACDKNQKEE